MRGRVRQMSTLTLRQRKGLEGWHCYEKEAKSGTVVGYGYFRSWGYAVG